MDPNGNQIQLDPTEDEEIVARVAAIDVAKDSGMVCTRVPHPDRPRRRVTTVWSVLQAPITELAGPSKFARDGGFSAGSLPYAPAPPGRPVEPGARSPTYR